MKIDKPMLTLQEWIHNYTDETREHFNEELYRRDDMAVIESLKKVILSCQRDCYFTIKVQNFTVVTEYSKIRKILYSYEQEKLNKNKNNSGKIQNPYSYIDLKPSDIMLLIVDYYLAINDPEKPETATHRVLIKVPRIVNKYYYRINGNLYSAIFQIVDGSTYNNTSSSSKKQSITFKTIFMPTRLYRNIYMCTDINGNDVKYTVYSSNIFKKNVPVIEYFLGKFGLYGALEFMGLQNIIRVTNEAGIVQDDENLYTFCKEDVYIQVPKYIFDNDIATQCTAMTIYRHVNPNAKYATICNRDHWLEWLAIKFNSKASIDKGLAVLDSLESIYDIETYESIRLPEEQKSDIYRILRWMVREFQGLRLKDNSDISTKRIRREPYIAAIYSTKMSKGIYRISDIQRKITMDDIKRFINIEPDYLIDKMTKDKLIAFRDGSNDNDGVAALKFSYKGISGLGDNQNSTIPDSYRHVHPSHIGRVDLDASSATDPGLTGIICPLSHVNRGSFAEEQYTEPIGWEETFNELVARNNQNKKALELISFQNDILGDLLDKAESVAKSNQRMDIAQYNKQLSTISLVSFIEADDGEYNEAEFIRDLENPDEVDMVIYKY